MVIGPPVAAVLTTRPCSAQFLILFVQQGELLKKAVVASPDTVDKSKPLSPSSPRGARDEALPAKSAVHAQERPESIFDKKELKRSTHDFENLKVFAAI